MKMSILKPCFTYVAIRALLNHFIHIVQSHVTLEEVQ